MSRFRIALLGCLPLLGGCTFDRIACDPSGACPSGYVCGSDRRCALAPDGGLPDGPGSGACILALSARWDNTCAIRGADKSLWCWGEFKVSGGADTMTPVRMTIPPVDQVMVGEGHACALAGTTVYCWGTNSGGQLGRGFDSSMELTPGVIPGFDAVELAVGDDHTCARRPDGSVWCWGTSDLGQNGQSQDVSSPARVGGLQNIVQIVAGKDHTCARSSSGVWCWGEGRYGQLGYGTTLNSATPYPVATLAAVDWIAAGALLTCAKKPDGTVVCWGPADHGELTQPGPQTCNSQPCASQPFAITLPAGAVPVAAMLLGEEHACARGSGGIFCWGSQEYGQLGTGLTSGMSMTPLLVTGSMDFQAALARSDALIAGGRHHGCVATPNGALWCWGSNSLGQLGVATQAQCGSSNVPCSAVPLAVPFPCN